MSMKKIQDGYDEEIAETDIWANLKDIAKSPKDLEEEERFERLAHETDTLFIDIPYYITCLVIRKLVQCIYTVQACVM